MIQIIGANYDIKFDIIKKKSDRPKNIKPLNKK